MDILEDTTRFGLCDAPLVSLVHSLPALCGKESKRGLPLPESHFCVGHQEAKLDPTSLGCDSQLRLKRSIYILDAFSDVSFTAGTVSRSHSGAVVSWGGAPITWTMQRQSTIAMSTAEAELNAALEGAVMLQSCSPIVSMLLRVKEKSIIRALYIDSVLIVPSFPWWRARGGRANMALKQQACEL